MCLEIIYSIYMYKKNLALSNLQLLICYKTKASQIKPKVDMPLNKEIKPNQTKPNRTKPNQKLIYH